MSVLLCELQIRYGHVSGKDRILLVGTAEFVVLFVAEREEDRKVNGNPMAKSGLFLFIFDMANNAQSQD